MLPQGFHGIGFPKNLTINLLNPILSLKGFERNPLLIEVNGMGVETGTNPSRRLQGSPAAVAPPGFLRPGGFGQIAGDQRFDGGDREPNLPRLLLLKVLIERIVFAARLNHEESKR